MEGPNVNAVLIAFFGMLNTGIICYVALQNAKHNRDLIRNTNETVKAKVAARQAAFQTDGGLDAHIRAVLDRLKAEESAARLDRIVKHVEQERTKESPPLPPNTP